MVRAVSEGREETVRPHNVSGALAFLLIFTALTGCVRSDGRNSDCKWPGEPEAKTLDLTQLWNQLHLSQDAEFAEDLAIRYADTHHGLRSKYFNSRETYREARDRCLEAMCKEIGQAHGVTSATVFESLGRNRAGIDLAVNLPFVLLYGFVASAMAGRVWRRYPPEDGWRVSVAIVVLCSAAFGVCGVLMGEQWSTVAENARIGTGHLSYRVERLPWARYRGELFAFTVILFWFIAALRYRKTDA